MTEPTLHPMLLLVCSYCRKGAGGECHTPGCSFCRSAAPDIPLTAVLSRAELIAAGEMAVMDLDGDGFWLDVDDATDGDCEAYDAAITARARREAEAVLIAAGVIEDDAREADDARCEERR